MQEIFEKIIESLEGRRGIAARDKYESKSSDDRGYYQGADYGYYKAIEIVNQVAEECKGNIRYNLAERYAIGMELYGVDITEKWLTAAANESALSRAYMLGKQDGLNKFDKWREEYGNGWIPCNVKLPEKEGNYLVSYGKDTYVFVESFNGKWFDEHFYYEQPKAWMNCPEPYKPKGEK